MRPGREYELARRAWAKFAGVDLRLKNLEKYCPDEVAVLLGRAIVEFRAAHTALAKWLDTQGDAQ